jgi:hypothetical protein
MTAAVLVAWLGMFLHNMADLPISAASPENILPGIIWITFLWLWVWDRRWSVVVGLGWAGLNLLGAFLTVLPLPVLPFAPEQSVRHYLFHALYAVTQLPVLYLLVRERRGIGPQGVADHSPP